MTVENKIKGLIQHNQELNLTIKESIQGALIKLMDSAEYQSISITELCKTAGVSRMAFYNNYKTKDDIIFSVIRDANKEIFEAIGSPFTDNISIEWYDNLFNTVLKYQIFIKMMFKAGFKYRYIEMINELVLHNARTLSNKEKYNRILWAGGIVNCIIMWIDTDLTETSHELANFCYNKLVKRK